MDTHRRLTAGPERDNLTAIVAAIQHEALCAYERAELLVGPLDTRTALGFVLTAALDELANCWPEAGFVDEIAEALLDLRTQLLSRPDDTAVAVLRYAAQTIFKLREDIERLQDDVDREAAELRAEIARLQAAANEANVVWTAR